MAGLIIWLPGTLTSRWPPLIVVLVTMRLNEEEERA